MSSHPPGTTPLLEIRKLAVTYGRGRRRRNAPGAPARPRAWNGPANVVDGIDLQIAVGEVYGLVGESGCGKTTIARTIVRSLPASAHTSGTVAVAGRDVLALRHGALREFRAREVAIVHQEPASALNPTMRAGRQVSEVFENLGIERGDARAAALDILGRTGMADPTSIARRYPHELSGGQQQRVVIAMALAARPRLLILDEPTVGLDATTERGVLELVDAMRRDIDASVLFISHRFDLVRRWCDRVGVLYSGRIVEEGAAHDLIARPRHPYTDGLLRCVPALHARHGTAVLEPLHGSLPSPAARPAGCAFSDRCHAVSDVCRRAEPPLTGEGRARLVRCWHAGARPPARTEPTSIHEVTGPEDEPLLRIEGVTVRHGDVVACDDIELTVRRGEVLAVVGESGSGKTTLARSVVGLVRYEGRIEFDGHDMLPIAERRRPDVRQRVQMVFQSADATLNPRHTVGAVLDRAIRRLGGEATVQELAMSVRLDPSLLALPTRVLSGGQKQRVAIARAFAGRPRLVVCDEPVSALDVSVQAAILQLLADLQRETAVSYLFISHDLAVVRHVAHRVAVMYQGQVVEIGPSEAIFDGPRHPYTDALLASAAISASGAVSTLARPRSLSQLAGASELSRLDPRPAGCRYHDRCRWAVTELCRTQPPPWRPVGDGHQIRCHLDPAELAARHAPSEPHTLGYHLGGSLRRETLD